METRLRFIPSRLTEEILLDVMVRIASFKPEVTNVGQRFFDAYAYEVSLIDKNGDGVLSFLEADINGTSDNLPNTRLYLPVTAFNRYAIAAGDAVLVTPGVPASINYGVVRVNPVAAGKGDFPYEFPPQTGVIWKVTKK